MTRIKHCFLIFLSLLCCFSCKQLKKDANGTHTTVINGNVLNGNWQSQCLSGKAPFSIEVTSLSWQHQYQLQFVASNGSINELISLFHDDSCQEKAIDFFRTGTAKLQISASLIGATNQQPNIDAKSYSLIAAYSHRGWIPLTDQALTGAKKLLGENIALNQANSEAVSESAEYTLTLQDDKINTVISSKLFPQLVEKTLDLTLNKQKER